MKPLMGILLGVLIGGVGIWTYDIYVRIPAAANEARLALSQTIEADRLTQELSISGLLLAKEGATLTLEVKSALESKTEDAEVVLITTDAATKVFQLENELAATRKTISLADLALGSRLTVISNQAVADQTTIYAKEIVAF